MSSGVLSDLISVRPHLIEQVDHDLLQFVRFRSRVAVSLQRVDEHALLRDPLLGIHDVALGKFQVGLPVAHLSISPRVPIDLPCSRRPAAGDGCGLALGLEPVEVRYLTLAGGGRLGQSAASSHNRLGLLP